MGNLSLVISIMGRFIGGAADCISGVSGSNPASLQFTRADCRIDTGNAVLWKGARERKICYTRFNPGKYSRTAEAAFNIIQLYML
jgi:hypothetical protein